MAKTCRCGMFAQKGICYHTGYKPTFSTDEPPIPEPPIPEAIKRMYAARRQEAADKQAEKQRKEQEKAR